MILFVPNVRQKYLKQVTLDNELTLAFLSVMGHKQRMMTGHLTLSYSNSGLDSHENCFEELWSPNPKSLETLLDCCVL